MSVVKRLYELQQLDIKIQRVQEALEEVRSRLGESEALLQAKSELLSEEGHLAEIEMKQRDVEWDIEDLRGNITELNKKLYSGKVGNPKELLSLDQEMGIFRTKLRQKEDNLLDLMTEAEATQDKIRIAAERLSGIETEWQQEQGALAHKQVETESQLGELNQRREELISEIASPTLELYEGIRLRKGQGIVKVEQGRCQGCHLTLPMSELQQARGGSVVQCSTCGRILYLG